MKMGISICDNKKCDDYDESDRRNCPKYKELTAVKCKKFIKKNNQFN